MTPTSDPGPAQRDLIKSALLKIDELQAKLKASVAEKTEAIAIVGMACRLPGGVNNPEDFWRLLDEGRDAITEVPAQRWDIEAYYDADPDAPGKMNTRYGGFIEQVEDFDARFFAISPREAQSMDPQQRLLLEVAWEALEFANIPPERVYGSAAGVFIGIIGQDYAQRLFAPAHLQQIDAYVGTGASQGVAAGRLSYCLGLTGPSFSVDTACSSSLVSLHLACESLRRRECELALSGGVNLILEPGLSINFSKARMMAPDGRCKSFDSGADGYVRGEGCGVLVLKRLSDALADGDRVLAVVRGSALNQDGPSGGLTVPSGPAQEQVIRQALRHAGLSPAAVSYVEAHGTGTALGDPIELGALDQVFSPSRSVDNPLYLGSVKTNVGHLEAAAGVAGIIKLVLALQHESLPRHLHCRQPTPRFPWADKPLRVLQASQPWQRGERPRIAGISSFGFSGTNAHVIIEEAPLALSAQSLQWDQAKPSNQPIETAGPVDLIPAVAATATAASASASPPQPLLVLSARSEPALRALALRYRDFLYASPNLAPLDLCASAATGRNHFPYRLALSAASIAAFAEALAAFADANPVEGLFTHPLPATTAPATAFLFTGQGAQYPGMGQRLYQTQPLFRQALDGCAEQLLPYCPVPLVELLFASTAAALDQTVYTQPALFCLEMALAEFWQALGVRPAAVLGHSVGEYVAACVAGVFSLADALKLLCARARLMQALPAGGAMAAVFADETRVTQVLSEQAATLADRLAIAAINGPDNVVISGEEAALQQVLETLQAQHVSHRRLQVSHAFHSPLMEPMLAAFAKVAAEVHFHAPRIPLISNVSGQLITGAIATPAYWLEHIRKPVRFADSVAALKQRRISLLLEIGPHPVLLGMAASLCPDAVLIPALRQHTADDQQVNRALGQLFVHGESIDWPSLYPKHRHQSLQLPTYPFQRQRFWVERSSSTNQTGNMAGSASKHPLLGQRLNLPALAEGEIRYQQTLNDNNYLQDHRVFQQALLPAAAFIEMALAAASRNGNTVLPGLEDVSIQQALIFADNRDKTMQLILTQTKEQAAHFEIYSLSDKPAQPWTCHATGGITAIAADSVPPPVNIKAVLAEFSDDIDIADFYRHCEQHGIAYGPNFQALQSLRRGDGQALGWIKLPERLLAEAAGYHIHPVLLDACFQILIATLVDSRANETWLPVGLDRLQLYRAPGTRLWCRAKVHNADERRFLTADLLLFDDEGGIIAVIEGFKAKQANANSLSTAASGQADDLESWLYRVDWQPRGLCSPNAHSALPASPTTMSAALNAAMTAGIRLSRLEQCGMALDELDKLCVAYVLRAFQDMGLSFQRQDCFSSLEAAIRLGIVPAHRQLFERMLEMLAEAGILLRNTDDWAVLHTLATPNPQQTAEELRGHYPQVSLELDLLEPCGSALARVLQGRCDPLQELLFPGGNGSALAALYRDPPGAQAVGAVFRQALLAALKPLPQRSGIRILEIGAGTGGASSFLLPHLPAERSEYVFTDISPAFTLQAQTTFAAYPFIEYKTLDIEKDPQAQGFKLQDYHIVVASNVLHATEDLAQTLKHTRSLLAPGGLLLMLEGSAPQNWIDLIFGMTGGWWRFNDKHLRPSHPLLSGSAWCDALQASGFQETDCIDCPPIHQSIIIAQTAAQALDQSLAKPWLIFADAGGTGLRLAQYLRATGSICTVVYPGSQYRRLQADSFSIDPYQAAHYQRLFSDLGDQGPAYCAHFWSLDTHTPNDDQSSLTASARLGWETALHLAQALGKNQLMAPPRLVLITRGAVSVSGEAVNSLAAAPVWGLGKSIALEYPELRCIRIDLPAMAGEDEIAAIVAEVSADSQAPLEDQIAFRGELRLVPRLVRHSAKRGLPQSEAYSLCVPATGNLDELVWSPSVRQAPKPDEVEILVRAAGLNFKDLLLALHSVAAAGPVLGIECAGTLTRVGSTVNHLAVGDSVLAMAPGSFSRYVNVPARTVAALPNNLSFEEAATLPIAFLTAAYALEDLAHLQAGERVLIHAASGGVGQAAIQLAQRAGAEIFATASVSKWPVLRGLGVKHIMSSRNLDFGDEIRRLTAGEGVDVVLNCLSGEFTSQSLALLRSGGRFLEIGITDLRSAEQVAELAPDVSYHTIDLMALYLEQPALLQGLLQRLIAEFGDGQLKPLPRTIFAAAEVESAFRTLQQAKHTGKLVLSFDSPALPFRKDASYLISGGLGDLGLLVAAWMAEHGAGHLILAGRRGVTPAIEAKIRGISQAGAEVSVFQVDIAKAEQTAKLLAEIATKLPALSGVIHAAGVLDDGVLSEQTPTRFSKVLEPKLDGAWQLHRQTLALPLEFFILFSSVTSVLGAVGQANHVSANAFLDALAHQRRANGLPALSINWGAWSEIGYAARVQAGDFLKAQGMGFIAPHDGLTALEQIFHSGSAQIAVAAIDWPSYLQRAAHSGYLANFRQEFSAPQSEPRQAAGEFRALLQAAAVGERLGLLSRHVALQVASVLGFPTTTAIDRKQGFFDMGMDSLTSIELRNRLRSSLGCPLPSTLAFDFPNVAALVEYLANELWRPEIIDASPAPETAVAVELESLQRLTEAEAEATLLKELEEMGFSS
ncbi:type I polyketide synthase [Methylomonas albis]|uniref:SDR family NAD(P)-dependent oxidoreductase n=1 Tax=Methylomonas albis TaxID=1854563 RepID=A0ABR9D6X5_9GAMM|nr:type I polyketide synthase [Methylomonas albis]MBD9358028.1 SDR family NAD(P)-dependent oxidoreductase [Methylomonas albis]